MKFAREFLTNALVGGVLIVVYGCITLGDVFSGRGPWGELVKGSE